MLDEHPLLFCILIFLLYTLFTYKGKRMEKVLNKTVYSKQEEIVGKVYSYAYFFCGVICFLTIASLYQGASSLVPPVKEWAVAYAICAFFIEIITFSLLKFSRLNTKMCYILPPNI